MKQALTHWHKVQSLLLLPNKAPGVQSVALPEAQSLAALLTVAMVQRRVQKLDLSVVQWAKIERIELRHNRINKTNSKPRPPMLKTKLFSTKPTVFVCKVKVYRWLKG